jgi:hypothetical protein
MLVIGALKEQGGKILEAIEQALLNDLFVPEDFEALVLAAADDNASVGKLLRELQEPRPSGQDCIPWLGETVMKERIVRLCARGKIAINLRGMEYLQAQAGERARKPLGSGCGRTSLTPDGSWTKCSSSSLPPFPRPGEWLPPRPRSRPAAFPHLRRRRAAYPLQARRPSSPAAFSAAGTV